MVILLCPTFLSLAMYFSRQIHFVVGAGGLIVTCLLTAVADDVFVSQLPADYFLSSFVWVTNNIVSDSIFTSTWIRRSFCCKQASRMFCSTLSGRYLSWLCNNFLCPPPIFHIAKDHIWEKTVWQSTPPTKFRGLCWKYHGVLSVRSVVGSFYQFTDVWAPDQYQCNCYTARELLPLSKTEYDICRRFYCPGEYLLDSFIYPWECDSSYDLKGVGDKLQHLQ